MNACGMDQAKLAKKAERSDAFVSGILNGKSCTAPSLKAVATALDVSVEELLLKESVPEKNVTRHRVSGDWKGTYTLFLSMVNELVTAEGKPYEDETWEIEGEIEALGNSGRAKMTFDSQRAKKTVSLPSIGLKIVDGSKFILEYDQEADESVLRLAVGILELCSYGKSLTGFYTTCDPAFDGKLIPAFIDLKKVVGTEERADNESSNPS